MSTELVVMRCARERFGLVKSRLAGVDRSELLVDVAGVGDDAEVKVRDEHHGYLADDDDSDRAGDEHLDYHRRRVAYSEHHRHRDVVVNYGGDEDEEDGAVPDRRQRQVKST